MMMMLMMLLSTLVFLITYVLPHELHLHCWSTLIASKEISRTDSLRIFCLYQRFNVWYHLYTIVMDFISLDSLVSPERILFLTIWKTLNFICFLLLVVSCCYFVFLKFFNPAAVYLILKNKFNDHVLFETQHGLDCKNGFVYYRRQSK